MPDLIQPLQEAIQAHQAGRLAEAATLYRQVLSQSPQNSEAHHWLGLLYSQQGRHEEAIAHLRQAVGLDSHNPIFLNNLGEACRRAGRLEEAAGHYRQALALSPALAPAHYNLGNTLKALGRLPEAIAHLRQAVQHQPNYTNAHHNLGNALMESGQLSAAAAAYRRVLALNPGHEQAGPNLANVCFTMGNLLADRGQTEGAIQAYQEAIQIRPDWAEAHNNLGAALQTNKQRLAEAARHYREAIRLRPELGGATYRNLGDALRMQGNTAEARQAYQNALAFDPADALLRLEMETLYPSIPQSNEEIDQMRAEVAATLERYQQIPLRIEVEKLHLGNPTPPSSFLYHGRDDRHLHEQWGRLFNGRLPSGDPKPNQGKPHIGFLVIQGHEGVFTKCVGGALNLLPAERFRLTVACNSEVGLRQVQQAVANPAVEYLYFPSDFRPALERLRAARFDLFYVWELGTDNLSYFLPFCQIAPVQCAGWGWPVTSGIPQVDYFLTCDLLETAGSEALFTEKVVRFQHLPTYYERPAVPTGRPSPEQFGLPAGKHFYFCAQNPLKVQPDFDLVVAEILRRDPAGLMVFVSRGDSYLPAILQQRWQRRIPDVLSQIRFLPRLFVPDYFALMTLSDVFLDTLYFGGVNTLYDAFAVGTPIVTLPGRFHRGRWGLIMCQLLGVEECVADSTAGYVDIALRLGTDAGYRAAVSRQITANAGVLFQDRRPVQELADFFEEVTRP